MSLQQMMMGIIASSGDQIARVLQNDFSVNSWNWYTYWNPAWWWLTIDTTNKRVVSWWSRWNWQVYKSVSYTKFMSRIKFNMTNTSISWNRWWAVYAWPCFFPSPSDNFWAYFLAQWWSMFLCLYIWWTDNQKSSSITLWLDYYLDFVANEWVFTAILYNSSLIEIDRYSVTDVAKKTVPYVWYCMWEHSATWHFNKIKEHRLST